MSRALMSSRAVTVIFWILLSRILIGSIQLVTVNICQNGRGKQTAQSVATRGTARERGADRACRDRLRRHVDAQDRAGEGSLEPHCVGGEAPFPLCPQRGGQSCGIERRSGALDDQEMRQREELLPATPLLETGKG